MIYCNTLNDLLQHINYVDNLPQHTTWMISGCYVAADQYIECNNGIGGFHENLVTFERPKTPPPPPLLHPIRRSHPVTMESPRGSSDIIMEIGRSSIFLFPRCARGTAFLSKIMESPRGSSVIIMEIGRSSESILLFPCP